MLSDKRIAEIEAQFKEGFDLPNNGSYACPVIKELISALREAKEEISAQRKHIKTFGLDKIYVYDPDQRHTWGKE